MRQPKQTGEQANLRAIFDVVNVGLLLVDEGGLVRRVNNTVSRWVGRDLSSSEPLPPGDLVGCVHAIACEAGCGHADHCSACPIRGAFESVLRTGRGVHRVETPAAVSVEGRQVLLWLEVSADPLVVNGRPHVVVALHDVTQRRQAQEAMRATQEELTRSNGDLEQFAHVVSHDLEEPLRMVTGFLGLLERTSSGELNEKARAYLAHALDGGLRMRELIDGLLAYSRAGRKGRSEPTDLQEVFETMRAALKFRIDEAGAAVTCDPLPTVRANAMEMTQVFQNLLDNAIKFRSAAAPIIHVGASETDGEWTFSVKDNGIGIDPRFSDRVFQIFHRLHTPEEYPGTGIGLAICKKIIERHGGRIGVEPALEGGSTFWFTLPGECKSPA